MLTVLRTRRLVAFNLSCSYYQFFLIIIYNIKLMQVYSLQGSHRGQKIYDQFRHFLSKNLQLLFSTQSTSESGTLFSLIWSLLILIIWCYGRWYCARSRPSLLLNKLKSIRTSLPCIFQMAIQLQTIQLPNMVSSTRDR